ncbi:hypothetical protein X471_00763 [Bartonella bacilliformis str. Heidi Mejia]|nr:hypothetical protein X471_00763 [Bartonella bacilliformis str. Heidi Mejia]KEG24883.1 hypothetical protein H706_00197 [Bartonella bacilliformis CAR600-02]
MQVLGEEAKRFLADKGDDLLYGARSLKRILQREIQDLLAEKILLGQIPEGASVHITKEGNELQFSVF